MDNPDHVRPGSRTQVPEGELHLPTLGRLLQTLDQVVEVDYRVPGCPPETERIAEVVGLLSAALDGKAELPPRGSVVGAGHSTVCDQCLRERHVKRITQFSRLQALPALDPSLCLLEQGIPCNGSATRDGCGGKCPAAGAPCIGCYGPADGVVDFGARLLSAFASVVDATEPDDIDRILDGLPDPVGQFYRFSLAGSLLRGSRAAHASPTSQGQEPPDDPPDHRPDHPSRGPRQDRDLPRRPWRRRATPTSRSPSCAGSSVLRRPAGRGDADPDQPDLRGLPGGAPPGRRQGARRGLPRRSAPAREAPPRAPLLRLLRDRPHHPLLRPGRAGLAGRTGRARSPIATSSG